jgi:hypothetical protein
MPKYEFIVHHELYPTSLGCRWTTDAESEELANKRADKICEHLQHGVKPKKRQGKLVHTPAKLVAE